MEHPERNADERETTDREPRQGDEAEARPVDEHEVNQALDLLGGETDVTAG